MSVESFIQPYLSSLASNTDIERADKKSSGYHALRATQMPTAKAHRLVNNAKVTKARVIVVVRGVKVWRMPTEITGMARISPAQPNLRG
jgi:hypothetical protein